jgi:signal transduction histidine kinase
LDVTLGHRRAADDYEAVLCSLREDVVRLRRIVEALLALARADAHQDVLVRERIDMGELVEQVTEAMQPVADERGVRLITSRRSGVRVIGDQAHLMQLLVNLVDNGLKYTPAGGSVSISVDFDDNAERSNARVVVRDTGRGIASEHLPHLFERFYQVEPERAVGGAGLGLAICRWIVEAHDGRIDVESREHEGTTFTVLLPLARG